MQHCRPKNLGTILLLPMTIAIQLDKAGPKTPYSKVAIKSATEDEYYTFQTNSGQTCTAQQVISITRAAFSYPYKVFTKDINEVAGRLINSSTFDGVKTWVNGVTENEDRKLTKYGEEEIKGISKRIATRLSTLFKTANLSEISLISANYSRVQLSAVACLGELKSSTGDTDRSPTRLVINNTLLLYYSSCGKFINEVFQNATAIKEIGEFQKNSLYQTMIRRMETKLGLEANDSLSIEEARAIFIYCIFELTLYNTSIWCDVLEDKDLEIMEYYEDLKIYWSKGYHYQVSSEMACVLVSRIFQEMNTFVEGEAKNSEKKALNFWFGHTLTLTSLFSSLGMYKVRKPLMADGFEEQKDRELKSSKIVPLAANLVFVLYKCNESTTTMIDNTPYDGRYFVKLYHNEREVQFPGCKMSPCPYRFLTSKYNDAIYRCNIAEVCSEDMSGATGLKFTLILLVSAILCQAELFV